jgi:hypothetical protein
MPDNVLVIPSTIVVGREFPPYLPLADGSLKPTAECTREEVQQAVNECRAVAESSRRALEDAYRAHLNDVEQLAQVSAYLARYEQWSAVRHGGTVAETMWNIDDED